MRSRRLMSPYWFLHKYVTTFFWVNSSCWHLQVLMYEDVRDLPCWVNYHAEDGVLIFSERFDNRNTGGIPNFLLRQYLNTPTIKEEIRRFNTCYRCRIKFHINCPAISLHLSSKNTQQTAVTLIKWTNQKGRSYWEISLTSLIKLVCGSVELIISTKNVV